jgi:pimeloyl-ACP methyl ester carboxylesterase
VLESKFDTTHAAKVQQPVLCIEGGEQPKRLVLMSQQISERTKQLLPQAQVLIIPRVNHASPLQDPETVAKAIASFVSGSSR